MSAAGIRSRSGVGGTRRGRARVEKGRSVVLLLRLLSLVLCGVAALAALAVLPSIACATAAGPSGLAVIERTETALTLDWEPAEKRLYYEVGLVGGSVERANGQGDPFGASSAHTW